MPKRVRVLVAEDDGLLRRTLVELLRMDPSFDIVSQAADGQAAFEHVGAIQPQVVLTDIEMPTMDGIELTRKVRESWPEIAVVVLTKFDDNERLFDAIRAGACAYVLKDAPIDEIKLAILEAREGKSHLSPALVAKVLSEFSRISQAARARRQAFSELTPRELEVLEMLGRGMRNKAIAEELFLSEKTVKTHVGAVLRKLQLNDRTEAALIAQRHSLP